MEQIRHLGTVLGVWAHPDDEAYLSAGLMALARDLGSRVVTVTATLGERGTNDPRRWPADRLASVRASELAASLAAVGVCEHHVLGYPDGRCAEVGDAEAVSALTDVLEELRPTTVLTFGADGFTGHPDHRAVGRWLTLAHRATRSRARLLRAAMSVEHAERFADLHRQLGAFEPGLPVPVDDPALVVRLSGAALDRKVVALRAHASQTADLVATLGEDRYAAWCAEEAFVEDS
jgi:LmbE family N-acetylglucosaminyl deacetylase